MILKRALEKNAKVIAFFPDPVISKNNEPSLTLLIRDLQPAPNKNVSSEKFLLYQPFILFPADLAKSVYFHLLFHCHYFPYLVLVFLFNCSLPLLLKMYVEAYKTSSF